MTTYTATTQESTTDLAILREGGLQLQVEKSVADTSGTVTYNVVYQSHDLAHNMTVQWTTNYALNWITSIPNAGAKVEYEGNWQTCNAGDSWDLDSTGSWQPNQNNPSAKKNCLNVGKNGYEENVYIVVGVADKSGHHSAIWVSPNKLLKNNGGECEPQETVTVWYEEGTKTESMVSTQQTDTKSSTLSPADDTVYFSYSTMKGKWLEPQPTPFSFPSS
ncbi:splicing factor 3b [Fusarium sp. NRRL 25303]|nr:splicing factor 3b [Fusarium sp. NRRL 25303]